MADWIIGPAISISILAALLLSDGLFIVAASERISNVHNHGSASFTGNTYIEQLCINSSEPAFCILIANDLNYTINASILELGLVAIDLALNKSYSTKAKIQSLNASSGDPKLKAGLRDCNKLYEDASSTLTAAIRRLNQKDYLFASLAGGNVISDALDCETVLNDPPLKSPLTEENHDLQLLAEFFAISVDLLDEQAKNLSSQVSASSSLLLFLFYLQFVLLCC